MKLIKFFFASKKYSSKYRKYFEIYESLLKKYLNKKIIFVEIGVLNGGSLEMWKKFFGPRARIIGIDLNPECKNFEKKGIEIYIGDQSCPKFWQSFFNKVGKVDIVIDDGGHTNLQQIITTVEVIPNIKDNGMLIVEDTHSSYMREFSNPGSYSFITFVKKIVDDINFKFNNLGSFKFSLNKYIYSVQTFESIIVFHVNQKKTYKNFFLENKKIHKNHLRDYRYSQSKISNFYYSKFLYKFKILKNFFLLHYAWKEIIFYLRYYENKKEIKKYLKFFK